MNYLEKLKNWLEEKIKIHNENWEWNIFKQWEIYYVNFWINIWSEFNWTRPAIIFELSRFSFWRKNVIVLPITSFKEWKKYNQFDFKITKNELNWLKKNSIIKLFHIRDISKNRVWTKIWILSEEELNKIQSTFTKIYIKKPGQNPGLLGSKPKSL